MRAVAATCLALCAALFAGARAEDEAHLVVRKTIVGDDCKIEKEGKTCIVQGLDTTISYSIFNVGASDAFDVKLTDASLDSDFQLVEAVNFKFTKIGAGENVTQNATATSKLTGAVTVGAAEISYKAVSDGEAITGASTSPEGIFSESERSNRKRTSFHWAEFSIYGFLSLFPVGIPAYIASTTDIHEKSE